MNLPARALNSRWMGLLLVLWSLGALADPPLKLPGRAPDSNEPWGFFLGRAAHFVVGRQYRVQHPTHAVFLNNVSLFSVVRRGALGDPERLAESVRLWRPDIVDVDDRTLFELKPDHPEGILQAREQAGLYLAALNTAVESGRKFVGGTGFEGSLFLEFKNGGALWQLSWRTLEPGVTLYRWSYRREKLEGSFAERAAQKEEALPEEEVERSGAIAEQVLRAAYKEGEWPDAFQGQVYLPVDCP